MKKITKYAPYQLTLGELAEGCKGCIKGKKLVLFVTGLCHYQCFYCPIAKNRRYKDVIYANEWQTGREGEILKEAKLTTATGAGITGGDPFLRIYRTIDFINLLKKEFGKKFHIHLYAPLENITKEKLEQLFDAGLDEIRVHPTNLNKEDLWYKIDWLKEFDWDYGVEIPAIPAEREQTFKIIDYIKDKAQFLNLNELEISEENSKIFAKRNFMPKDRISYGIEGSEEFAKEIMDYCQKNTNLNVHYCSCKFKDKIQMGLRLRFRAKNIARKFDIVDEEGMLTRGVIFLKELKPGFSYHENIGKIKNRNKVIMKLKNIRKELISNCKIKHDLLEVDAEKLRLLTSSKIIRKIADKVKQLGLIPAIVKEYPTRDAMELEVKFL
jgi:hypothetical protein